MHPGPMNEGVEITPEVAHGPQSLIADQVTNGLAVRMAVLYLLVAATEEKQDLIADRAPSAQSPEKGGHDARPGQ